MFWGLLVFFLPSFSVAEQSAALLSCFVFGEKTDTDGKLKEQLAGPLRMLQDTARRIAKVSNDCKLPIDEEEYVQVGQRRSKLEHLWVMRWDGGTFAPSRCLCVTATFFPGLSCGYDGCGVLLVRRSQVL